MSGWVAVDLDGTIAEHYWPHGGAYDELRVGEPIAPMCARVRAWIAEGRDVRIFTARVGPQGSAPGFGPNRERVVAAIKAWTLEHLGVELDVTCTKDYGMVALYDDRSYHVVKNTGELCCGHGDVT